MKKIMIGCLVALLLVGTNGIASADSKKGKILEKIVNPLEIKDKKTVSGELDGTYYTVFTTQNPVTWQQASDYTETLNGQDYSLAVFTTDEDMAYIVDLVNDTKQTAWLDLVDVSGEYVGVKFDNSASYNYTLKVPSSGTLNAFVVQYEGVSSSGSIPSTVPEPGTMMLMGLGLAGLAGYGRKRTARKE